MHSICRQHSRLHTCCHMAGTLPHRRIAARTTSGRRNRCISEKSGLTGFGVMACDSGFRSLARSLYLFTKTVLLGRAHMGYAFATNSPYRPASCCC